LTCVTHSSGDANHELYDPELARQFKANFKSGSGTPPGSGLSTLTLGNKTPRRSVMTPRDKVDFIREHGNDAFLDLPA